MVGHAGREDANRSQTNKDQCVRTGAIVHRGKSVFTQAECRLSGTVKGRKSSRPAAEA